MWIKRQDRLPDESGDVLIYTAGGSIELTFFNRNAHANGQPRFSGYDVPCHDGIYPNSVVTHWMSLPAPPTAESGGSKTATPPNTASATCSHVYESCSMHNHTHVFCRKCGYNYEE
jgi:hypothetical protein